MADVTEFRLSQREDGTLTIGLAPPLPVGGWDTRFQVLKRFDGSSGLITKSMASGYYGVSGMNIVNSGEGIFRVTIDAVDTSGLTPGNYAFNVTRLDSGLRTQLSTGYFVLLP